MRRSSTTPMPPLGARHMGGPAERVDGGIQALSCTLGSPEMHGPLLTSDPSGPCHSQLNVSAPSPSVKLNVGDGSVPGELAVSVTAGVGVEVSSVYVSAPATLVWPAWSVTVTVSV